MFCGARRAARRIATARDGAYGAVLGTASGAVSGASQAYVYRFARGVGGSAWSHHSNDIPFWFGALEAVAAGGPPVPKGNTRMLITTYLIAPLIRLSRQGDPPSQNRQYAHADYNLDLIAPLIRQCGRRGTNGRHGHPPGELCTHGSARRRLGRRPLACLYDRRTDLAAPRHGSAGWKRRFGRRAQSHARGGRACNPVCLLGRAPHV